MALRDLLLKIAGDGDDAKRELADVAKEAAEFARQEYEAIADVDTTPAETALERAKRELRDYGRISVEAAAGVEIAKGEAQLERIKTRLDNLSRQEASPKVDAQTTQALLQLNRVQQRVDKLKASRAEVKVDVDRGPVGIIESITQAVGGLITALGSGGGGGLAGPTARISAGFISFGTAAGPLAAILAALAVTIGVSLVGALAALVASLAAAVAAVGVLAVALAGALGPVLAVVIAAVARFAKVIQALRAQSAATQQAQQQAAAGSAAVTAAAGQQEAAARALTDANDRLGKATTQAYREMADAAEAARDAVRGVATAEDQRDQADLNTRTAIARLQELRGELNATGQTYDDVFNKFTDVAIDTSGLQAAIAAASGGDVGEADQLKLEQAILDVRTARNREKDAINGVSDAETTRTRAQQRANQFARQGIAASEGYAAALRGVEDAQRQVAAAADQQNLAAAQAKAQVLTDNLTESERKLLGVLQEVGAAIRAALGPATDAVLAGLAGSLGNIAKLVTALKPAFTAIGVAIAGALIAFSGELVKPEWIAALNALALGGAQLVGIFTSDLFIPFLQILRDVAVAALPLLLAGLRAFGDVLKGLATDAGGGELGTLFEGLVEHLSSWLQLGLAIGAVFLAFFKDAAGPGKSLVETMTKGALALAAWLNSDAGRKSVSDFFEKTLPTAISFVRAIIALVTAFIAFGVEAAPIVGQLLNLITFLLQHIKDVAFLVGGPFIHAWILVKAAIDPVKSVIQSIPKVIEDVKTAVRGVGNAFSDAFENAKRAVGDAIEAIGARFTAFVKTAESIGTKIGNAIVGGIRSALNALSGVGKSIGNFVIGAINTVFGLLNKIHIKLPEVLGVGGGEIGFNITPLEQLAAGGITTGRTIAEIGEQPGVREAVLPLTTRVFGELAGAIVAQMRQLVVPSLAVPRLAFAGGVAGTGNVAGGGPRTVIEELTVELVVPGGGLPDAQATATSLTQLVERRFAGGPRQDL